MRAESLVRRAMIGFAGTTAWARLIKAAWTRRRVMNELASMDEHLLRDMGITRQDLDSVLADPSPVDPTLRLAARAREARWSRRASALEERQWAAMVREAEPSAEPTPSSRAA